MRNNYFLLLLLLPLNGLSYNPAKSDSSDANEKPPKHYLKNCVYLNTYTTPERKTKNTDLGNYSFSQSSIGFCVPLITQDGSSKDSTGISNIHLLLVGNSTVSSPRFDAIENNHQFTKTSLGLRIIYNTGKKSIWFFNGSPFVVYDNFDRTSKALRYASVLVYNRTVNEKFSYRVGLVKTFIFGNRYTLPLIGFRFGPLDGTYVSVQLLRNISLHFPMNKRLYGSVFVKPVGGLYNVINNDTLYPGNDKIIQFGRYELLNGIRLDYTGKNFDFYISSGITKRNRIALASTSFNKNRRGFVTPFYKEELKSATFIEAGLNVKFGRVKKVYNNMNMYDVFDLNNTIDTGDNNTTLSNSEIPKPGSADDLKKIQYKDVQDLIELEDIY